MMANSNLPKSRWTAFAGHLLISIVILLALAAVIAYVFFPDALFQLAGGIEGLKIIAGVDIVLGPLITLFIYNINKPRKALLRDLLIIGLIQISALSAGMYIVHNSRPVVVLYAYDTIHAVKRSEFADADTELPKNLPLLSPGYFYLDLPEDNGEALEIMAMMEFGETSPRVSSHLFIPMEQDSAALLDMLRTKEKERAEPECVVRDIVTPFDATKACFDATHRRVLEFSLEQNTPKKKAAEET